MYKATQDNITYRKDEQKGSRNQSLLTACVTEKCFFASSSDPTPFDDRFDARQKAVLCTWHVENGCGVDQSLVSECHGWRSKSPFNTPSKISKPITFTWRESPADSLESSNAMQHASYEEAVDPAVQTFCDHCRLSESFAASFDHPLPRHTCDNSELKYGL